MPTRPYENIQAETSRLQSAMASVKQHLATQAQQPHGRIFQAHLMMLSDPEVWQTVTIAIEKGLIAEQAWIETMDALAQDYRNAESEYMRET
ncbi:phosphoenolpyruvate-utilizing N-terminal domain-containing protein [Vibrio sp. PP-XX7]